MQSSAGWKGSACTCITIKLNFVHSLLHHCTKLSHLTPGWQCVKGAHSVPSTGFSSVQFSPSVVSNSLWPHESQHVRPPCPSPTPRVYPNSCPSSRWCHQAISSSVVPFLLLPPIPLSIRIFSNESTLCTRWPKYWSFSLNISPSSEHPGLISFRMDCLDILAGTARASQEFSLTPQFKSINSSALSFLHSLTLTSIHDHRKNHSLD